MEQAKLYAAACKRINVPFVFSSNGHQTLNTVRNAHLYENEGSIELRELMKRVALAEL